MKENIFNALPGFDRLLEQKPFDSLSEMEKEEVLKFITEEDYNLFREAVLVAHHGIPPIAPDPSVKNRLLQTSFPVEKSQPASTSGTLSRLLNYSIPLYQAGIAASFLLLVVFYLLLQNYRMPGQVAIADTVYVDKPILRKDTVWLEKPEVSKPEKAMAEKHQRKIYKKNPIEQPLPENQIYASQMRDAMSRMSIISSLGKDKSLTRDASLMKMVAVGY
jgi:hypothetical protein